MALSNNQAEPSQQRGTRQYGDTYIYGDATVQLGDKYAMHSDLFEHGTEEQRRAGKLLIFGLIPAWLMSSSAFQCIELRRCGRKATTTGSDRYWACLFRLGERHQAL